MDLYIFSEKLLDSKMATCMHVLEAEMSQSKKCTTCKATCSGTAWECVECHYTYCSHDCAKNLPWMTGVKNRATLPIGVGMALISLILAINEIIAEEHAPPPDYTGSSPGTRKILMEIDARNKSHTKFSFGMLRKLVATHGLSDYFDVIVECLLVESKDCIKPFEVEVLSWKMTSAIEQYMERTSVPLIKV